MNMHKSISTLILTFFGLIMLTSCDRNNIGEWEITDLSQDTLLTASTTAKSVAVILLKVKGYADDSIKVHGIRIPGGPIDIDIRSDWYDQEVKVGFDPYKATKGYLRIQYHVPSAY
ncbi:hypothetical protein [Sphingobacterium paucimobilis]|nr:hypothetical protein [Sphingobacterium paucimobilis]